MCIVIIWESSQQTACNGYVFICVLSSFSLLSRLSPFSSIVVSWFFFHVLKLYICIFCCCCWSFTFEIHTRAGRLVLQSIVQSINEIRWMMSLPFVCLLFYSQYFTFFSIIHSNTTTLMTPFLFFLLPLLLLLLLLSTLKLLFCYFVQLIISFFDVICIETVFIYHWKTKNCRFVCVRVQTYTMCFSFVDAHSKH